MGYDRAEGGSEEEVSGDVEEARRGRMKKLLARRWKE